MGARGKRLICLFLLLGMIFIFGYFFVTCSRFRDPKVPKDEIVGKYLSSDAKTILEITQDEVILEFGSGELRCQVLEYESGLIRSIGWEDGTEYLFAVLSENQLYSGYQNQYFYRVV